MAQPTTVATVFLDPELSGTPVRICRIAKYLDKQRFRSVVVIPDGGCEFAARLRAAGAVVYEVPNLVRPRRTLNPWRVARWARWVWPSIRSVREILLREQPAIVHAYGLTQFIGPCAAVGTGARVVWHINDDSLPRSVALLYLPVVRALADRVAVSSRALARHYFGGEYRKRPDGVQVLYSTVDLVEFRPTLARDVVRSQLGVQTEVLIGMVGNLEPSKGHLVFVRAAPILKARTKRLLKFVIVGRELELHRKFAESVKAEIRRLGVASDFVLTGHRSDVADLLAAMDVLVVPSRWEPLGVIVMEAMAAGTPIVASNAGGIPEMIEDGVHGLLFPSGDSRNLAASLARLLEQPGLGPALAQCAKERVRSEFAPENAARAYADFYESILRSAR